MKNPTFWIRLFIGGAIFLFTANRLQAQGTISFEELSRGAKPATLVVAKTPTAATPAKSTAAKLRIDTVRVHDTVTVTVVRVDTVKVGQPVPVASAVKPAAPAAVPFAPPTVNGMFQFQATGGDSLLRSTYRVRRAEVKMVSDLGKKIQAVLMIDVAKALSLSTSGTTTTVSQGSRALQDAYVSVPVGRATIEAGQQRLPLSWEGSFSSSTLETIDRALFESDRARGGSFGDVRDLGVAAKGKWSMLDYRAGLFNGSGETMNDTDKNAGKAVVAQLGVRPKWIPGFRLGMSGVTSGKAAGDKPTRDRLGADVLYQRKRLHVQVEAMGGQDALVKRFGGYSLVGVNVSKTVKVVGRVDAWDPDVSKETAAANVTERDYLGGLTWLPAGTRLKVQFAVVRKTYTRDIIPAVRQVLTQVQASW